ncbi:MAG TPA: segregation/condensation protein A, partial [Rhodothermales bacterium]
MTPFLNFVRTSTGASEAPHQRPLPGMYRVHLQDFEGPMDLLLYFIRRDEIDIHDIPISRIANEFLEYVRVLEEIDLDGVGDFIYMAAVLINIKARVLLPSDEVDEEGEPIDPRRELVERLLEYIRFKEASDSLEAQHEARSELFTRTAPPTEAAELMAGHEVALDVSVFDLVSALRRILTEADAEPVHEIR